MVSDVIYGALTGDSDVNALISGRCSPLVANQGSTTPYVTYFTVTGYEDKTKGGNPIDNPRVQIDCFAGTMAELNDLMTKVDTALKAYSGSGYGVDVREIRRESDNTTEADVKKRLYRGSRDYRVRIKQ